MRFCILNSRQSGWVGGAREDWTARGILLPGNVPIVRKNCEFMCYWVILRCTGIKEGQLENMLTCS